MAQKNLLFTWKPESFNAALEQPNLVDLRTEVAERRALSESLLIWKKGHENESWWLIDLGTKKIYHLDISSDTEVAVSEETQDPRERGYPWPNLDQQVYATAQGFVDWLIINFKADLDAYDIEILKRTDLSEKNLSFEIVHPNLLTVHEMFREILASPSEWAVGWLDNNLQQKIQTNLNNFLKILEAIRYFGSHASQTEYKEVLKQTFNLCNKVQQQLQQIVTYLKAKKAEQLDPQMAERLETQVKNIADKVLEGFREENNLSHESTKQDIVKAEEKLDQLNRRIENEIAKESVSKHKKIFAKQAEEHQRASRRWLIATGGLIIAFGAVFYWLFEALRLGGTELIGVLQNVFTKGFLLTLIYFVLNRSNKNYAAQKHLEVVNRHRQNALDTFEDFFESAGDNPETRHAVLAAATDAIFDANQSGYLSTKTKGSDSANPIQQVVRTAFPGSSTRSED